MVLVGELVWFNVVGEPVGVVDGELDGESDGEADGNVDGDSDGNSLVGSVVVGGPVVVVTIQRVVEVDDPCWVRCGVTGVSVTSRVPCWSTAIIDSVAADVTTMTMGSVWVMVSATRSVHAFLETPVGTRRFDFPSRRSETGSGSGWAQVAASATRSGWESCSGLATVSVTALAPGSGLGSEMGSVSVQVM